MAIKKIVPHGDWESPISVESIASNTKSITSPRVCAHTGNAYFVESAEGNRNTIVEISDTGLRDILPSQYSVHNTVYEYGGSLYDVLPDGRLIFSNKDNTVHILDPKDGSVNLTVNQSGLRYSSFNANIELPFVLAIEEDHTIDDTPDQVQNYIVAINVCTTEVTRVVSGADFYFSPAFSIDGTKLAWLEWNRPDLPFDAAKLYCADWEEGGVTSHTRLVAGEQRQSVAEPRWGHDGSLYFAQEIEGYRQLFRVAPGSGAATQIRLQGLQNSEFGEIRLFEGSRSYALLSTQHLFASAILNGVCQLIVADLNTMTWKKVVSTEEICHVNFDAITRFDDSSVLVVGEGIAAAAALHLINIHQPEKNKVIRRSVEDDDIKAMYSKPEPICVTMPAPQPRTVYGFVWMPRNPKFIAPEGERPPLIVNTHGGPTGYSGCGLSLKTQYFTSRGYAYCMVNYTGSTGHGREYRERLFGRWGAIDADDAAGCADYLVSKGLVRPGAVGITGHSAGGYNTLQCLTRCPYSFASGVCISGISDLKTFDGSTHKLESDYTPALVLPRGASEELKERLYYERSSINYLKKFKSPLLLLHGKADTVVPVDQAWAVADALEKRKADVKLVEFAGEGHMMSQTGTVRAWMKEEEKWWRRTLLGFEDEGNAWV